MNGRPGAVWGVFLSIWLLGSTVGVSHWKLDDDGNIVAVENGAGPLANYQNFNKANVRLMQLSYNLETARLRNFQPNNDHDATKLESTKSNEHDGSPANDSVEKMTNVTSPPTKPATKPTTKPTKSPRRKTKSQKKPVEVAVPRILTPLPLLEYSVEDVARIRQLDANVLASHDEKLRQESQVLDTPSILSCGDPVAKSRFDHLSGVNGRYEIEQFVEKDVYSNVFPMNSPSNIDVLRTSNLFELLKNNVELHSRLESLRGTTALWNAVGQLYRVRGNTTVAIECFRTIIAKAAADEDALLNLCDTLFRLEKWTEAEEVMRYSLSLPKHSETGQNHFALGRTLLAQGRSTEAVSSFKACLQLNPNHHTAQAGLAVSRSLASEGGGNNYTPVLIAVCVCLTLTLVWWVVGSQNAPKPKENKKSSQTAKRVDLKGTASSSSSSSSSSASNSKSKVRKTRLRSLTSR
eukprot:m.194463 g.194463  ORF g.194463 m.194463 type:complete len:464 (+) comp32529_c0_seq5:291-1682(+)